MKKMVIRKIQNKKGVSAVIATVLIILITVAAVTIIWAAIIPMINNQLDKGKVCFDAISQLSIPNQGYTCVSEDGKNTTLQIKRGPLNFELTDVQVIFSSGGNSYSYALSDASTTLDPETITFPNINEERVYVIDTSSISGELESVDIAPVVTIGNSQEVCDVSSSAKLNVC